MVINKLKVSRLSFLLHDLWHRSCAQYSWPPTQQLCGCMNSYIFFISYAFSCLFLSHGCCCTTYIIHRSGTLQMVIEKLNVNRLAFLFAWPHCCCVHYPWPPMQWLCWVHDLPHILHVLCLLSLQLWSSSSSSCGTTCIIHRAGDTPTPPTPTPTPPPPHPNPPTPPHPHPHPHPTPHTRTQNQMIKWCQTET